MSNLKIFDKVLDEVKALCDATVDALKSDASKLEAKIAADKAYIESRVVAIETKLGIVAPPPNL